MNGRCVQRINLEGWLDFVILFFVLFGAVGLICKYSPSLVTFGPQLALNLFKSEASANDGTVRDPLLGNPPSALAEESAVRAVNILQFTARDVLREP